MKYRQQIEMHHCIRGCRFPMPDPPFVLLVEFPYHKLKPKSTTSSKKKLHIRLGCFSCDGGVRSRPPPRGCDRQRRGAGVGQSVHGCRQLGQIPWGVSKALRKEPGASKGRFTSKVAGSLGRVFEGRST